MTSLILRTASVFLLPLLVLLSVFMVVRGHNLPGGGFVAGLVASAAIALYALGHGVAMARRAIGFNPRTVLAGGLLVAGLSGIPAVFVSHPFLTGVWLDLPIPGLGSLTLGTPLLFDVGVYLAVFGVTTVIVLTLMED